MIEELLLCYFSGTGNALTAARWIAASAEGRGVRTRLYSIEEQDTVALPSLREGSLLGICFPTHGFSAPWIVIRFVARLPRRPGVRVFLLNTRAGAMIGGLALPGLSGIATWLLMLMLALKGIGTRGVLPLDMPHSWTMLCPPNRRGDITRIIASCRRRVEQMASHLLAEGSYYRYSIWLTLPLDLALLPGAMGYMLIGRFVLPKTVFATVECNACRLCEQNCPTGSIRIVDQRPFWRSSCENCGRCMNICPRRCIQSWLGRAMLLAVVMTSVGVSVWPGSGRLWRILASVGLIAVYPLLHRLWGIRWVNRAFEYTSLSRYWRRYIAPDLKARDLHSPGGASAPTEEETGARR